MTRAGAARARVARNRARRRTAGGLVVALVVGGLGYAAVASDGSTVHEADLNDAGVWVSSAQQAKFAKANVPIGQLETGVATDASAGAGLDVLQDGAVVLGLNTGTGELFPLDARTSTAGEPVAQVAAVSGAEGRFVPRPVDLRGGTLALLDPASGKVFAQRVDPKAGTSAFPDVAVGAKPVATVGKNAALAVGVDGTVHVVSGARRHGHDDRRDPHRLRRPGRHRLRAAVHPPGPHGRRHDVGGLRRRDRPGLHRGRAGRHRRPGDRRRQPGRRPAAARTRGRHRRRGVRAAARRRCRSTVASRPAASSSASRSTGYRGPPSSPDRSSSGAASTPPGPSRTRSSTARTAAATGDEPTATLPADGAEPTRDGVAFRVNRGLVVLNDLDNGGVWDLDDKPTKIDNWDALTPPTRQDDENDKKDENLLDEAALQQPPTATPDSLQVRPGRTSKLHVLDNDTDVAGSVLAIDQRDVTRADARRRRGQRLRRRPGHRRVGAGGDREPVVRVLLQGQQRQGRSPRSRRRSVSGSSPTRSTAPRPCGRAGPTLAAQVYPVIAGKRLSVPVLADWRDPENDVLAARADVEGAVVDGQGRVTLAAPTTEGKQSVGYVVTDGRGGTTKGAVSALVISPSGDSPFVAPKTQPDAVRGVIGKPLQVEPLGNDVAGADPGEPDATLRLRSEVRPVGPLQVDTDLATGQVTVTGSAPGTFELSYSATTGAGAAPGRIRVDLVAPPEGAPPVSVPDTATLHDQAPAMVDVLANDYSPRGDVLVTAAVSSSGDSSWIQPSIYQGRWVRLEATQPAPTGDQGRRGTVTYTVSDGTQRVTGQVSVLQQGAITDSLPIVVDDTATVREGDTVSIPVLDNDTMADGIPLRLDPASVKVVSKGDAQRAFASGNVIRYVPEATGLTAEKFVTIEYAAYADGMKERAQTARARVQVTPLPSAQRLNQSPVARSFTATVTAGDPLTMTVPTFGVDPDGDSVSVAGVVGQDGKAVDLTYGRVVGIGPSTIKYEAYPLAAGTEVITYEVTDRFGATSRAFVRVGVVQPGDPQPPVAVADEVFAAPGKTVTVKPLVNDLIARGDVVEVDVESLNDAATRKEWQVDEDHTVTTKVPADTTALHQLVYGISDGLFDPSRASILVRAVKDWVNPPVANDDVAAPKPGETSTLVDVLANDTDVDSDPATLKIVEVLSPGAVIENGRVRVQVLDHPSSVPYVIEDEDGARAMALVHVPTGANGQPFVVAGTVIQMDPDSTTTVPLNDHVRSPRGRVVSVTTADTLSASPAENLAVSMPDNRTLELTSSNGYVGPAAVMVEVTDQDAVDQEDFGTAYVSVPVQIGPKVPLLRCPDGAVTVTAGGLDRTVDIPTFCHAWLPVGMSLDDVTFDTRWETEADADLAVDGPGNRTLTLHAGPDAKSSTGRLSVTSPGLATPSTIAVRVVGAPTDGTPAEDPVPPPTLRPISVTGLEEGESRTVDVRPYLDSPLPQPECSITGTSVESGTALTATASGCRLTLTVGAKPSLTASVAITVSDGPDRSAQGRVSVTMLGRPSAPRQVTAVADRDAGGQARVSWLPPTYDGGSVVTRYVVRHTGGSTGQTECSASPCTVTGLTNGEDYRFTVAAVNGIGEGEESAPSAAVRPDRLPERVTGVRMVTRGDGTLTIAWDAPVNEGSALRKYVVRLISSTGQTRTQDVAAPTRQAVVTGLDNMAEQSVQVQAWNELGAGPFGPAVTMQSAGTPQALPKPTIQASGPGPAASSATLTISWAQGSPNGPPTTKYTLYQSVGSGAWTRVTTTAPDVRSAKVVIPYDGRTYRYTATLTNGAGLESAKTNSSTFTSNGVPSDPSVTASTPASNQKIRLTVTVGQPRAASFTAIRWSGGGKSGTVTCGCAAGSQKVFDVGPFDTNPTKNYTITVRTENSGGAQSNPASASATPYGPTLTPTGFNGSRSGATGAQWSWNLPENGRNVDQVQLDGDVTGTYGGNKTSQSIDRGPGTYRLRVRSHSAAGWSGWTGYQSVTVPRPNPTVTNVHKGARIRVPNGSGSCAVSTCPKVLFDINDFPVGGGGWTVTVIYRGGSFSSSVPLYPTGSGNSYSWGSSGMVVADGNAPVSVRLCRGGTCYTSAPNNSW